MTKDLLSIMDLSAEEMKQLFDLTADLKAKQKRREPHAILAGKTLGMIFAKPSTRTRVSFQVGIYQLGGVGLYLSGNDLQLGRGETIADTAKVLSRYLDGIMIRTFNHQDVVDLATNGTIPVINGLTDLLHPCQVLADMFTIQEKLGDYRGKKIVFVGDGANNMANSWVEGAALGGMHLVIMAPEGHEPDSKILQATESARESSGGTYTFADSTSSDMLKDANVVYTDVWASMGPEAEAAARKAKMQPFQLNSEFMSKCKPDTLIMHCLPAHRGDEITDDVLDSANSIVFDEAENRLHVQKAIMATLME
ncbi:MAG: ornithine carbamoyltransferase [Candidatus Kerfeldbacteria bacterium]|nr:ornithine carbamoyltransferase [Candidatus Kerfeldbacteria bacterium]